jgi:hypothetical protein
VSDDERKKFLVGMVTDHNMAPLSTNLQVLVTAMCPRRWCSSMADSTSVALADLSVCMTLYRQHHVHGM